MNKKGFTLMELMVVVIIIATFAALVYPSFVSSIERARASEAVHMIGAIQAAQQKHFVNYEVYGADFRDINDFRPAISDFNPAQNSFSTEYFTYQMNSEDNSVVATRIGVNGAESNKGYDLIGFYGERFIRCRVTSDDGEKVCASLTDRTKIEDYYPIF